MEKPRILLNLSNHGWQRIMRPQLERALHELGTVQRFNPDVQRVSQDEFLQLVGAHDIMVTSWGSRPLAAEDAGRTGRLRLLVHGAGSVKGIVAREVVAAGVRVTQSASAIAKAVAHYTVGLIVLGLRNSVGRYLLLRQGQRAPWPYQDLEGIAVGLVGLSQVGRQVPALLHPFGARVLAYDPYWAPDQAAQLGVSLVPTLAELVEQVDVLSLHAPLLPSTRGLLSRELIERLRPGSLLVNTARGALVDQDALFERCYRGELVAYLDVTVPEPLPPDHPAWQCPYIFITPHISGPTRQTLERIGHMVVENISRFQRNEPLLGEVTLDRYDLLA